MWSAGLNPRIAVRIHPMAEVFLNFTHWRGLSKFEYLNSVKLRHKLEFWAAFNPNLTGSFRHTSSPPRTFFFSAMLYIRIRYVLETLSLPSPSPCCRTNKITKYTCAWYEHVSNVFLFVHTCCKEFCDSCRSHGWFWCNRNFTIA